MERSILKLNASLHQAHRVLDNLFSVKDFRKKAEDILPPHIFHFIDGGAMDEVTLSRNQHALDAITLLPRVLEGIQSPDLGCEFFGDRVSSPLIVAPTAYQKLVHPEGEVAMLRAANALDLIFTVGMFSTTDYGLLARDATTPLWAQMYFLKDRRINNAYIERVTHLGYKALVVTVDAPVYGKRERERQYPLVFPKTMSFDHLTSLGLSFDVYLKDSTHFSTLVDPYITWEDIDNLKNITSLPIILKGILHPKDTAIAVTFPHVKGVIVSNHGGRQMEGVPSAIEVFEKHRAIAPKDFYLFVDGAMNRGHHILKGLAKGAHGVLLGRSTLWGLAVGGEEGVKHVLKILMNELRESFHLCGIRSLQALWESCDLFLD